MGTGREGPAGLSSHQAPRAAQQGEFQQRGPCGKLGFSSFPWQLVFSKPEAGEDPCGGSLQTCREAAAPACGWGVTGGGPAPPQVAEGQVVPGRQRLGSSRRDPLSPVGGTLF